MMLGMCFYWGRKNDIFSLFFTVREKNQIKSINMDSTSYFIFLTAAVL